MCCSPSLRRSCIRTRCLVVRSARAVRFDDQVRRDFRDGDILRMGGWLLSRTELRLCGLVALGGDPADRRDRYLLSPAPSHWRMTSSGPRRTPTSSCRQARPRSSSSCDRERPEPQRVAVRINGQTIDELPAERAWLRARYPIKSSGRSAFAVGSIDNSRMEAAKRLPHVGRRDSTGCIICDARQRSAAEFAYRGPLQQHHEA